MYVQWLLEFVWRIFIQGPLMFINFLSNNHNINFLTSGIRFFSGKDNNNIVKAIIPHMQSLVSLSIILAIAAALLIMIFIYRLMRIMITSYEGYMKSQIVSLAKAFLKSFMIILVFSLCFAVLFTLFDKLMGSINSAMFKYGGKNGEGGGLIEKIPGLLYSLITNGQKPPNKDLFLFPSDNFLVAMDSMNWIVSIVMVISYAWFLLWMIWSIFQKMLEIFFLYLTFPIATSIGLNSEEVNYRVWVKEIINKLVLIIVLLLFLSIFQYMFYFIMEAFKKKWVGEKNEKNWLYIGLIITLALGSSVMFLVKLFSLRSKEHVGVFGTYQSFKQTKNFINHNQTIKYNEDYKFELSPINENINSLKSEITHFNNSLNTNYENLMKAKVFNK